MLDAKNPFAHFIYGSVYFILCNCIYIRTIYRKIFIAVHKFHQSFLTYNCFKVVSPFIYIEHLTLNYLLEIYNLLVILYCQHSHFLKYLQRLYNIYMMQLQYYNFKLTSSKYLFKNIVILKSWPVRELRILFKLIFLA